MARPLAVAVSTVAAGREAAGVKVSFFPSVDSDDVPANGWLPLRSVRAAPAVTGTEKLIDGLTVRATPVAPGAGVRSEAASVGLKITSTK